MTREERRQARIERYRKLAANATAQSEELFRKSSRMAEVIPFGQPILVGHYSEKSDRNYRNRIRNTMDKSAEAAQKALYYEQKAKAAESNDAIYLEDEDSVRKLEEKLKKHIRLQEQMKAANKIVKSKKLSDQEKIEELMGLGLSNESAVGLISPNRFQGPGFAPYQLSNNNAIIRNTKRRLEQAVKLKNTESEEYMIADVKVVTNTEDNRLQLFFPDKPDEEMRKKLKQNGFRWSPSNGCWQSYLTRIQADRARRIING